MLVKKRHLSSLDHKLELLQRRDSTLIKTLQIRPIFSDEMRLSGCLVNRSW